MKMDGLYPAVSGVAYCLNSLFFNKILGRMSYSKGPFRTRHNNANEADVRSRAVYRKGSAGPKVRRTADSLKMIARI
jgi:hypothetical protein